MDQRQSGQGSAKGGSSGLTPEQKLARARRLREMQARKNRYRRALFGIILLVVVVISFAAIKALNGSDDAPTDMGLDIADWGISEDEAEEALYDGPPLATIAFVGDISTSADQVEAVTALDGTYNFAEAFSGVSDHIYNSDYAVANFESTIVDGKAFGGDPYYNSPVQLAGALRNLGFRLVSTANTYALNNGIDGLNSTKYYLTESRLRTVGTYTSQAERDLNGGAYIRNIHKIKFAFLSYTKGTDSVTMPEGCEYALNTLYEDYSDYWTDLKSSQIRKDVQAAKDAGAEVIVALVHWGSEYGRSVREPQREAAQLLMENGVDVIIGTHSHVVSEMEFVEVEQSDGTTKTCFVAYGLGDFYTDPEQPEAQQSVILNLEFARGEDGFVTVTDVSYVPIYHYIYEENGKRKFAVLDVYQSLADIKRTEINSAGAELHNELLDTLNTLHNYLGEEYDEGPDDEDMRIVEMALEDGEYSVSEIRDMKKEEQRAAKAAAEEAEEG